MIVLFFGFPYYFHFCGRGVVPPGRRPALSALELLSRHESVHGAGGLARCRKTKSPFFTNSPRPPTYIFKSTQYTLRAQHTHTALFLCLRSVEEEVGVALGEEVVEPVDGRDARGQLAAPLVPLPLHLVRVIRFGFGLGLGSLSCSAA